MRVTRFGKETRATGPGIMRTIDILLTSEIEGGTLPFSHGELDIRFHMWAGDNGLPLFDGALWAFVDWVLPDISGLEVCRRLRGDPVTSGAHITMILDDGDPETRRRAMRTGADDYMPGPVDRNALLDRVLSVDFHECDQLAARALQTGDLTIDAAAFRARWQGKPIDLRPNEFRLLRYFVEHPGRVFSRQQLIAALGKQEPAIDERTVDVWIGRLRRALRTVGAGNPLRTVRSLGYVYDGV